MIGAIVFSSAEIYLKQEPSVLTIYYLDIKISNVSHVSAAVACNHRLVGHDNIALNKVKPRDY